LWERTHQLNAGDVRQ